MIFRLAMMTALVLLATTPQDAVAGRTELELRETDVAYSGDEPLEVVLRLPSRGAIGSRIDMARLEFTLDVDGDAGSFVPFMMVASLVEAVGPSAGYRPVCPEVGREVILLPGPGQRVPMDVTGFMRRWYEAGNELCLRIQVVEPLESARPSESIRLPGAEGILGQITLVTR